MECISSIIYALFNNGLHSDTFWTMEVALLKAIVVNLLDSNSRVGMYVH